MLVDFTKFQELLDVGGRKDFVVLIDCADGVFNGDPDNEGQQRICLYTGKAIVTDVAFKRTIRDNWTIMAQQGLISMDPEEGLYMGHRSVLNSKHDIIYKECEITGSEPSKDDVPANLVEKLVDGGVPVPLPSEAFSLVPKDGEEGWVMHYDASLDTDAKVAALAQFELNGGVALKKFVERLTKKAKKRTLKDDELTKLTARLCAKYEDARMLGAVASTGNSCGNAKGPIQILQGTSIDPLEVQERAITRVAITRVEDMATKRQDMGRKAPCPYMLVRFHGFFSPPFAKRTGVSKSDMSDFWNAVYNYGRHSTSSMRGHIEPAGIYVFCHKDPLGCRGGHAHELFDRIKVTRREGVEHPRRFADYDVAVNDRGLPEGIKLIRLFERKVER